MGHGMFGDFDPAAYEAEAEERWGDGEAYRQSVRRTASYSQADWDIIRSESDVIYRAFAELMSAGTPAEDPAPAELVDRHRDHISRWFYECTAEIHAGLGRMYVADERFTETIDRAGEGLAAYMSEAIAARYS